MNFLSFVTLVAGLLTLMICVAKWKSSTIYDKMVKLGLASLMILSSSVRTMLYKPGLEPIPVWVLLVYDLLFIIIAVSQILNLFVGEKHA